MESIISTIQCRLSNHRTQLLVLRHPPAWVWIHGPTMALLVSGPAPRSHTMQLMAISLTMEENITWTLVLSGMTFTRHQWAQPQPPFPPQHTTSPIILQEPMPLKEHSCTSTVGITISFTLLASAVAMTSPGQLQDKSIRLKFAVRPQRQETS